MRVSIYRKLLQTATLGFGVDLEALRNDKSLRLVGLLGLVELPRFTEIAGIRWKRKQEIHVSLLNCSGGLNEKVARRRSVSLDQAKSIVKESIIKNALKFLAGRHDVTTLPVLHLIEKGTDRSLVLRCSFSADTQDKIRQLSGALFNELGDYPEICPPHATLYIGTHQRFGIGISSEEAIAKYTKQVWTSNQ